MRANFHEDAVKFEKFAIVYKIKRNYPVDFTSTYIPVISLESATDYWLSPDS
mgnify:CR=1 FL=1